MVIGVPCLEVNTKLSAKIGGSLSKMAQPQLRMPGPPANGDRSDGFLADETTALLGNHAETKLAASLRRHRAVVLVTAALGLTALVAMVLVAVWWVHVFGEVGTYAFPLFLRLLLLLCGPLWLS